MRRCWCCPSGRPWHNSVSFGYFGVPETDVWVQGVAIYPTGSYPASGSGRAGSHSRLLVAFG